MSIDCGDGRELETFIHGMMIMRHVTDDVKAITLFTVRATVIRIVCLHGNVKI